MPFLISLLTIFAVSGVLVEMLGISSSGQPFMFMNTSVLVFAAWYVPDVHEALREQRPKTLREEWHVLLRVIGAHDVRVPAHRTRSDA